MSTILTWLVRYGHVLGAATWVGSYAALVFAIIPVMEKQPSELLLRLAVGVVRLGTYAGTLTIGFGIVLITRTRGFASLIGGEWGGLVLICFVAAIALLGIGDGAVRPALRALATETGKRTARRWALIGFGITVLVIGMMTRAVYARS